MLGAVLLARTPANIKQAVFGKRKQLIGAAQHASRAKQRTDKQIGFLSLVGRVASDPELRFEVQLMTRDLHAAWERLERAYLLVNAASGPVPRQLTDSDSPTTQNWSSGHFDHDEVRP